MLSGEMEVLRLRLLLKSSILQSAAVAVEGLITVQEAVRAVYKRIHLPMHTHLRFQKLHPLFPERRIPLQSVQAAHTEMLRLLHFREMQAETQHL
jgi:hypothetical protein